MVWLWKDTPDITQSLSLEASGQFKATDVGFLCFLGRRRQPLTSWLAPHSAQAH